MVKRRLALLASPVFEGDEDKTRSAHLLNTVSLVLLATQLIALFVPVYYGSTVRRVLLAGSLGIVTIAVQALMRRGLVRLASYLFVSGLWLALTLAAVTGGGLRAPAFAGFVIPIMCAGLLLGYRATWWTLAATVVAGAVLVVTENQGLLPQATGPFSPFALFATRIIFLVLVGALLHLAMHGINESLRKSRQEVAERKRAEEALLKSEAAIRASEARFREFFEDSLTGDYISTPGGKLIACNPAFARILGFESVEEALNCDTRSLFPDSERMKALLARLKEQGRLDHVETELRRQDGMCLHVVQNAVGAFDETGQLVEIKGYMFDITERRRLEDQLLQSQKIEAIGRLAGGVAHDFNNLLTIILSYSDLLSLPSGNQSDSVRKYIEEIKNAGERAAALTQQLLAFSRQQVLDVRVIDLNGVVTSSLQMLNRLIGEDVEFRTNLDSDPQWVKADRGQLDQVVMNLVVNARDAMPCGGTLEIETSSVVIDEPSNGGLGDSPPGSYVMLAVRDTGNGMDDETRAHLFEPFYTTKERGKGTGLGLATVHGIVKQSGGHISVESAPGRGASFRIFLPLADSTGTGSKREQARPAASKGGETILLVEDDDQVREVARQMLEMNGYVVLQSDAEDAVENCRDFKGSIHLLLSDLVMPKINGRELAERLAVVRPEMKVLFMSGYTDNVILDRGIHTRGIALLDKPFTFETLLAKVRSVLDS
jgi:two-component system, cell cycle sensor histidine kinase and response regulator CckA